MFLKMNDRNYTSLSYVGDCVLWNKIQGREDVISMHCTELSQRLVCGFRSPVYRWKHWKNLSFMSSSVVVSQDVLFRGRQVWVNHPKRSFCKHQLAISNAKWTCKQLKDFWRSCEINCWWFQEKLTYNHDLWMLILGEVFAIALLSLSWVMLPVAPRSLSHSAMDFSSCSAPPNYLSLSPC